MDFFDNIDWTNAKSWMWVVLLILYIVKDLGTKIIELLKTKQEKKKTEAEATKNTNINDQVLKELKKISQQYDNNLTEQTAKEFVTLIYYYATRELIDFIIENKNKKDFSAKDIKTKITDLDFEIYNILDKKTYKEIKLTEFMELFLNPDNLIECLTNLSEMKDKHIKETVTNVSNVSLQTVIKKIIK